MNRKKLFNTHRQEAGVSSLLKVTIRGECLGDSFARHHEEAGAVNQTPCLVGSIGVEL